MGARSPGAGPAGPWLPGHVSGSSGVDGWCTAQCGVPGAPDRSRSCAQSPRARESVGLPTLATNQDGREHPTRAKHCVRPVGPTPRLHTLWLYCAPMVFYGIWRMVVSADGQGPCTRVLAHGAPVGQRWSAYNVQRKPLPLRNFNPRRRLEMCPQCPVASDVWTAGAECCCSLALPRPLTLHGGLHTGTHTCQRSAPHATAFHCSLCLSARAPPLPLPPAPAPQRPFIDPVTREKVKFVYEKDGQAELIEAFDMEVGGGGNRKAAK